MVNFVKGANPRWFDEMTDLFFHGSKWQLSGHDSFGMQSTEGSSALTPEEVVSWEGDDGHYASYGICESQPSCFEIRAILPDEYVGDMSDLGKEKKKTPPKTYNEVADEHSHTEDSDDSDDDDDDE